MSITLNRDLKTKLATIKQQLDNLNVTLGERCSAMGVSDRTYRRIISGERFNEKAIKKLIALRDKKLNNLGKLIEKA